MPKVIPEWADRMYIDTTTKLQSDVAHGVTAEVTIEHRSNVCPGVTVSMYVTAMPDAPDGTGVSIGSRLELDPERVDPKNMASIINCLGRLMIDASHIMAPRRDRRQVWIRESHEKGQADG